MEANRLELELPMAHLNILEMTDSNTSTVSSPESNTRVLRRRKSAAPEISRSSNRRVSMKPRRHIVMENANQKQIEALYLDNKVKSLSRTLETIYEEPKANSTDPNHLFSGRKVKRLVTFQIGSQYTKEKIKKRRAKIKKLLGKQSYIINRKKISMNEFLKAIECLELDEVIQPEKQIVDDAVV